VFEKRLIESYIAENGTDPVTGEDLTVEDLVNLRTDGIVRPRPPTQTSVPALLATFQSEWDAIALETYELKKQLAQTRQELSTALYDYEGALRLIVKLTKERDDARSALAKVQVGAGASGSDSMEIDGAELPENLVQAIDTVQQQYVYWLLSNLWLTNPDCHQREENDLFPPIGLQQLKLRILNQQNQHGLSQSFTKHVPLFQKIKEMLREPKLSSTEMKMEQLLFSEPMVLPPKYLSVAVSPTA
jgi:hypothetical protein